MQVLEHLADPKLFFEELDRILKSGGDIYLAFPNMESFWKSFFGKNWLSGWFAPFHLFHYSEKAIRLLADERGFNIVQSWQSTPTSWFLLNLKAVLYRNISDLDSVRTIFDSRFCLVLFGIVLRFFEFFIKEKDCLVVHLSKK